MMPEGGLEQLRPFDAVHDDLLAAIERVLKAKTCLTPDMGGTATTEFLGTAITEAVHLM